MTKYKWLRTSNVLFSAKEKYEFIVKYVKSFEATEVKEEEQTL